MTAVETTQIATIHGRVSYSETGAGRPVVILHSLLTDRRAFERVVPRLAGRMISMDLPGFGDTTRVSANIDTFADLLADATRVIAGDIAPIVMGNGLGAFVALGMATRHPELAHRLLLVGCGATFPRSARAAFGNMIELAEDVGMEAVIPIALRRIYSEDYLEGHPEEAEERSRVLARTDTAAFINACRALQTVDYTGSASSLSTPTLIVVGSEDRATPPEMAARLADLVPNSTMVTLPGVAHAPQLEDPDGFIEAIEHFLEEA